MCTFYHSQCFIYWSAFTEQCGVVLFELRSERFCVAGLCFGRTCCWYIRFFPHWHQVKVLGLFCNVCTSISTVSPFRSCFLLFHGTVFWSNSKDWFILKQRQLLYHVSYIHILNNCWTSLRVQKAVCTIVSPSALIPTSLNMNMFQQNGASGCVSVSDFDGQFWRLMYHFSKATGGQTRVTKGRLASLCYKLVYLLLNNRVVRCSLVFFYINNKEE